MMNKPVFTPSADWRKHFEFQVQYANKPEPFKLDPLLEHYSTIKQPNRTVSTP